MPDVESSISQPAEPAVPRSYPARVEPGSVEPLSPDALAALLVDAGQAEVRAAFACGLASGLLPVLVAVLGGGEVAAGGVGAFGFQIALWSMFLALAGGLATFFDALALRVADLLIALVRQLPTALGRRDRIVARLLDDPISPRERRLLAKSVAAQCATTFAVLGAAAAVLGWIGG